MPILTRREGRDVKDIQQISLGNYESVVGTSVIEEIRCLADRLSGRKVVHINSTKVGGGVAEILQKLIPLMHDAKIDTEWKVMAGNDQFFDITKEMHNALHGAEWHVSQKKLSHYADVNKMNADQMEELNKSDFVVIHDPQPVAMINHFPKRKGKWIWRCHIDISTPNPAIWDFLRTYIAQYDAAVFHVDSFAKKDLMIRQFIIPPSIDPLSPKNQDMTHEEVNTIFNRFGIPPKKPIASQVGRFDRFKDPQGVILMFKQLRRASSNMDVKRGSVGDGIVESTRLGKKELDFQLIIAGGLAADDPEGQEVHQEISRMVKEERDAHILVLPPFADREINAIQRASKVVLQKSLKEGFALTVSEALWKGTPVVGGNTGGIPLQIVNGINGFLVNSIDEAADGVRFLLTHAEEAVRMGAVGREHVKRNFLITRHVRDHLLMYLTLELIPQKLIKL